MTFYLYTSPRLVELLVDVVAVNVSMTWAIMCEIRLAAGAVASACSDCHCFSHSCQIKTALQLGGGGFMVKA